MIRSALVAVSLLVSIVADAAVAQTPQGFVPDGTARVRSFSKLDYPPVARTARVQGAVVVRATIGSTGAVAEAVALSGGGLITEAAVANVKQWTFEPGPTTLILVYLFEIDGACSRSGTFFRLGNAENIARVTVCSQDVVR